MREDGRFRPPLGWQRAAPFAYVCFEFVLEQLQCRQHGRRGGITERAERLADDVVGHAEQQVDILRPPFPALDALEELVEPVAAFAARRALAARLVAIE